MHPSVVLVVEVVEVVVVEVVEVDGGVGVHVFVQTPPAPQHELIAQTWPGAQSLVWVQFGVTHSKLLAQTPHVLSGFWNT